MELQAQADCCERLETQGVLECADGEVIPWSDNAGGGSAFLLQMGEDSLLAWRRSDNDGWSFSYADKLIVEAHVDPLSLGTESHELASRFKSLGRIGEPIKGGPSYWNLKLRGGLNNAPFVIPQLLPGQGRVFPMSVAKSLAAFEPTGTSLFATPQDNDQTWHWNKLNGQGTSTRRHSAAQAEREVKVAILDCGGYSPTGADRHIVQAGFNFTSAPSVKCGSDRHGPTCLQLAADIIDRAGAQHQVKLYPYRVFVDQECAPESRLIEALQHAANAGIHIVVCPWLIYQDSTALEQLIGELGKKGILFLTAPANLEKLNLDECSCSQRMAFWTPCNIGVVAATDRDDDWPYSYGPQRVDVGAPGDNVYNRFGAGIRVRSGCSYAVSIASAAVAVAWSRDRSGETPVQFWHRHIHTGRLCRGTRPTGHHCQSRRIISI